MTYRNLRTALLGSAVGAGLLVAGGPAHALSTQIGDVSIVFDTTVSLGAQISVQDPTRALISEANGGNQAPPVTVRNPAASNPFATDLTGGLAGTGPITVNAVPDQSFGASINGDDGRLNFERGDFTSATIKATHDLQATWRNFTLFARANEFFDFVQADPDNFKRNGIAEEKQEEAVRDVRLLDLYISGDFDVGSLPVNLRAGKQVISWGEGTFIQNGINVINPIDVSAFRRPGVEIKEGLIPVWAIYGSVGLPFDLSLEAFYQLDWEPFSLDVAGTHFATSDVANPNSSFGGNQGIGFFSGSAFPNAVRQNCAGSSFEAALRGDGLGPAGIAAANAVFPTCQVGSLTDFNTRLTPGQAESQLIALNPLLGTRRGDDGTADDSGQFGLALRWYAEALNSTEFGVYFVNYHSRLPYAQIAPTAGQLPEVILGTESASGNTANKSLRFNGCAFFLGLATDSVAGSFADATMSQNTAVKVSDPNGTLAALAPVADAIFGIPGSGAVGAVGDNAVSVVNSLAANGANAFDASRINCAMARLTSDLDGGTMGTLDGEPILGLQQDLTTTLVYPEDIELWGLSFNTTVGTWGVQGEFTYRRNMPFQTDTDQATILAAGGGQCSGLVGFGDVLGLGINALSTSPLRPTQDLSRNCNLQFVDPSNPTFNPAFVREEMFTAQIGTTATFTNSNPLIQMIGADLGILVTEFGLVHVPDVPDEVTNTGAPQDRFLRFANICTSGTDLPLGGILALDNRDGCRPTETSYGYNLLGRLDYFNAFGTAWTVSPQVAWRHDVEGFTPAPVSNFREDFRSINLSVSANFQNTWTVSAGYTAFMGDPKFHNNIDQDFASLTATYSF